MKNNWLALAGALVSLCVVGSISTPTLMAQARPALVQDTDEAARAPFLVDVEMDQNSDSFLPVSIPSGFRLVVDFVSIAGSQQAARPSHPTILITASVNGKTPVEYLFLPQQLSDVAGFYYDQKKVAIYADKLTVGPGWVGPNRPTSQFFRVSISGHLVKIP